MCSKYVRIFSILGNTQQMQNQSMTGTDMGKS